MGLVNEISASRIPRSLTRWFRILGVSSPVPQLAPEVAVGFDIANPPLELRILGGEKSYVAGINVAAGGAGKSEYVQLGSPVGSNLLVVLEGFIVYQRTGATPIQIGFGLSTFSTRTIQVTSDRDSRQNPGLTFATTSGAYFCGSTDATADGVVLDNNAGTLVLQANASPLFLPIPYVLTPGNAFSILDQTQNLAFGATVVYRERALEDSELVA